MSRFSCGLAVLVIGMLLGAGALAQAALPDDKEKAKPKGAPTLDDGTATLTETSGGKEKKTKLELKYCLKVKGYFDGDGLNLEEVEADGPATKMTDTAGMGANVMLEKGDIIREVDGKPIKSAQDYVKAMNGASDPAKVKLKVRDVRTGQDAEFFAEAAKRE
jgi:C-terminal processing protease CtpA/Prc